MNQFQKKNYIPNNLEIFLILILSIILVFLSRYFYPFGYEPDFWIRAPAYILGENHVWNIIEFDVVDYLRDIFSIIYKNINFDVKCNFPVESVKQHLIEGSSINTPTSLWQKIDHYTCTQNFNQIFLRISLYLLFFSIFWIMLFSLSFLDKKNTSFYQNTFSICLSLFFPSMIFYTGLLSKEQIVLLFSLFFILFRNSSISILFLFIVIALDFGNGFFVLIYFIGNLFFNLIYKFFNLKVYVFVILSLIIVSYLFSVHILNYILINYENYLPSFINSFLRGIIDHHYVEGFLDKYPLFLRPIITFMSFNFFIPGNIKIIPLYFYSFVFLTLLLFNAIFIQYKRLNAIEKEILSNKIIEVINASVIIIITVLILPAYCNAKYYIFLLPLFFSLGLVIYGYNKLILFNIFANLIVLINLAMYRF